MARSLVSSGGTTYLLQEDSFVILLENSDRLLTEETPTTGRSLASTRGVASGRSVIGTRTVI